MSAPLERKYSRPVRSFTTFQPTPRARRALIALLALALALSVWYSWPNAADPELAAVAAPRLARDYPATDFAPRVTQTGKLGSYAVKFTGTDRGRDVFVIVRMQVTATGPEVVSVDYYYGSFRNLPAWALNIALTLALVFLVFFWAIPRTFGHRCPRHGCLLNSDEAVVQAPTWDPSGLNRPAIIERTYACPQCDFRHVKVFPDPHYRPVQVWADQLGYRQWHLDAFEKMRKRRLERAVTDEQFDQMLADAKKRALEKTSRDSLWREV